MKLKLAVAITLVNLLFLNSYIFASDARDFDKAVSKAKVHMRSSCGYLQKAQEESESDKLSQFAKITADEMNLSKEDWLKVVTDYKARPPVIYQADAEWAGRLEKISANYDIMLKEIENRDFKDAFNVCAETCAFFVQMHEVNNLEYVSDKLFHFRKFVKKNISDRIQSKDYASIKTYLKELLSKRDEVILCLPNPDDHKTLNEFIDLRNSFSRSVENFATMVILERFDEVKSASLQMLSDFNKLYDICISEAS